MAGFTPPPGVYFSDTVYFYQGSASADVSLPFGRAIGVGFADQSQWPLVRRDRHREPGAGQCGVRIADGAVARVRAANAAKGHEVATPLKAAQMKIAPRANIGLWRRSFALAKRVAAIAPR